jgi:hypothetical protein
LLYFAIASALEVAVILTLLTRKSVGDSCLTVTREDEFHSQGEEAEMDQNEQNADDVG